MGGGTAAPQTLLHPSPNREWNTPSPRLIPLRAYGTSTRPIIKSWVRHWIQ